MKLPRLSGREVVSILTKNGFVVVRQKGSHIVMHKISSEGDWRPVVPNHTEIDRGTLLNLIRQAGYTKEEFIRLIEKL